MTGGPYSCASTLNNVGSSEFLTFTEPETQT